MKPRTRKLNEIDRSRIWHPFTQMQEWRVLDNIIIEYGKGSYLVDTEGRRYIDAISSMWTNVHGHGKKEIDDAIRAQLKKIAHSTLLGLGNVASIELAEALVEIAPKGLNKVFYSDDGSTAVEAALKIAFQYCEQTYRNNTKKKFVSFSGAYHGDTFGSMAVGEIDVFVDTFKPLLFDSIRSPYPYCYRCPLKKSHPDCALACLKAFEATIKAQHKEIAACIVEPLFEGAAGIITMPPGFLKGIRAITRKYNVLLIADEVATGFGRTGAYFACVREGVRPDIICLAKGLSGGYLPLAATITTDEVYGAFLGSYDEYKSFFHGHTYTGNPLGCAAALASIDIFRKEKVLQRMKPKVALLARLLKSLSTMRHVGDVRQCGLAAGVELVKDRSTKERFRAADRVGARVCMEARSHGVMLRPLGDTIVIMPPLSILDKELSQIVTAIRSSVEAVLGAQ